MGVSLLAQSSGRFPEGGLRNWFIGVRGNVPRVRSRSTLEETHGGEEAARERADGEEGAREGQFRLFEPVPEGRGYGVVPAPHERLRQESPFRRQAGRRRRPEGALPPRVRSDARRVVLPPAETPAAGRRDPPGSR